MMGKLYRVSQCAAAGGALLFAGTALAHKGHKAHEHGVASVSIAVDKTQVGVDLEVPGVDIFGFEHPPHGTAQKQAVANALTSLRTQPLVLFQLPADLGCKATKVDVKANGMEETPKAPAKLAKATPKSTKQPEEDHADVDASYIFSCQKAPDGAAMQLGLLKAFPHIHLARVQVLSGTLQKGLQIHAASEEIKL